MYKLHFLLHPRLHVQSILKQLLLTYDTSLILFLHLHFYLFFFFKLLFQNLYVPWLELAFFYT